MTGVVSEAQVVFRYCNPLAGGLLEPVDGLRVVLRHAMAEVVGTTQVEFRLGMTLFGFLPEGHEDFLDALRRLFAEFPTLLMGHGQSSQGRQQG